MNKCQDGWKEGKEDITPFIKYLLQTIIAAYKDFDERISVIDKKLPAIEQVRQAITQKIWRFTKSEIQELCPALKRTSIQNSLTSLVNEGFITINKKGRSTYYLRSDAF